MSSNFSETKRNEVIAYFDMKRYVQAQDAAKELLSADPNDEYALYMLGNCCYMLDKYDEAERFCKDVITSYLAVDTLKLLGKIYRETKRYKNSEEFFLKSLELDPQRADTLAEYSYLLLICGYTKKANEVMQEALRLDPENSIVLHYNYYFEHTHGSKKQEKTSMEQYIVNSSDEVQKLLKIGMTEFKNSHFKSAKEYFRQAFLLEPTNEYILEMLEQLNEINHIIFFPNRLFSKIHPFILIFCVPVSVIAIMVILAMFNQLLFTTFAVSFFVCMVLLVIWSWLSRSIYNFRTLDMTHVKKIIIGDYSLETTL